ncbi:hypothetical protein CTM50_01430 [Prevotella intermedia]|uniref:Uncharacterized protein n=1 Tax=Prevotella intermedia TaxID=28131 RepID=A0A2D3N939_PREIN|nr:hypothetical protein CTM50_01430 [Prevotella intermedia]
MEDVQAEKCGENKKRSLRGLHLIIKRNIRKTKSRPNGQLYENNSEKILFSHDILLSLQQVIRVMQSFAYDRRKWVITYCISELIRLLKTNHLNLNDRFLRKYNRNVLKKRYFCTCNEKIWTTISRIYKMPIY